jgi:hypothetical protein
VQIEVSLAASIQNSPSRSLTQQGFSLRGVPNRRSLRTLRNKCFFEASVPSYLALSNRAHLHSRPRR